MQLGILGAILVIILAGGAVFFSMRGDTTRTVMENGVMKKDETMATNDVMTKDESMMEKDVMVKDTTEGNDEAMMEKDTMMTHGGTYEVFSPEKVTWAQSGKVVLFFRAGWCPTCRVVDADIKNNLSSIPKNITILDVNYDTETALKAKYGVTYQHTFVQVDAEGKQIAKWSGSPTLAALVSEVK